MASGGVCASVRWTSVFLRGTPWSPPLVNTSLLTGLALNWYLVVCVLINHTERMDVHVQFVWLDIDKCIMYKEIAQISLKN